LPWFVLETLNQKTDLLLLVVELSPLLSEPVGL
jgi:hypothetical protein